MPPNHEKREVVQHLESSWESQSTVANDSNDPEGNDGTSPVQQVMKAAEHVASSEESLSKDANNSDNLQRDAICERNDMASLTIRCNLCKKNFSWQELLVHKMRHQNAGIN